MATLHALARSRTARQHPVCVALLDIDHFKRVNDRFGHEVGDAALKAFAHACRGALRGQDVLGRMGGEEFLLLMPGTRTDTAAVAFGRLRDALQSATVDGMPAHERLSFSMGCAELPREGDVADALRRADAALYRAKAEGRDRMAPAA